MAFKNKDLSVIAYANGFTCWQYRTDDAIETVCADNYIPKEIKQLMYTGDIVIINALDGTTVRCVNMSNEFIRLTKLA